MSFYPQQIKQFQKNVRAEEMPESLNERQKTAITVLNKLWELPDPLPKILDIF